MVMYGTVWAIACGVRIRFQRKMFGTTGFCLFSSDSQNSPMFLCLLAGAGGHLADPLGSMYPSTPGILTGETIKGITAYRGFDEDYTVGFFSLR